MTNHVLELILAGVAGFCLKVAIDHTRSTWFWYQIRRQVQVTQTPEQEEAGRQAREAFQETAAAHHKLWLELDPETAAPDDVFYAWRQLRAAQKKMQNTFESTK